MVGAWACLLVVEKDYIMAELTADLMASEWVGRLAA